MIGNAIVYPLISLSKIEGQQCAINTLNDLWTVFWPEIGDDHSVDVCAVTSMGLYENIGYKTRHKKRIKCARFYREYCDAIAARIHVDNAVIPRAYSMREWDLLLHQADALKPMVQAMGKLHNYYDSSVPFRIAMHDLCERSNVPPTEENIAFFLEEFAGYYLMGERVLRTPLNDRSLRRDEKGAVYLVYPGETSEAEIMVWNFLHGRREYKPGRTFNVDMSDPLKPSFLDMSEVVGFSISAAEA